MYVTTLFWIDPDKIATEFDEPDIPEYAWTLITVLPGPNAGSLVAVWFGEWRRVN